MKIVCIDTNILARYFTKDILSQFEEAKKILLGAENGKYQVFIDEVILAETIWLLIRYYKLEKQAVISSLTELVGQNFFVNPRKELLIKAMYLYSKFNISYPDCWVYTISKENDYELKSFDKDLLKR